VKIAVVRHLLVWVLAISFAGKATAESRLNPAANLRCNAKVSPLAVEESAPELEWKLTSSDVNARGVMQTAYRVIVASSPQLLNKSLGDLWDSGRVTSGETFEVPYQGKPLQPERSYFWKVMVWDDHGEPAPWSASATWSTAPKLWTAKWIAQAGATNLTETMPLFRHEFKVTNKPTRAMLYVAALGQGEVHLNGKKVGADELAPGWTDYRKTVRYEAYDVTTLLHEGTNALGVMVGNGMFNVVKTPHRYTKLANSFGRPMILLEIHLEYADGHSQIIATDSSWTSSPGSITFSSTYGGEDYDAQKQQTGWDSPGSPNKGWANVAVVDGPGGRLQPELALPLRVMKTYQPLSKTEVKPGITVFDLGQNFAGWPAIEVKGSPGATLKMIPGESLNPDGTVSQISSKGPQWFSYTLSGQGVVETWHPRFSYYGFRYVQVEWTSGSGEIVSLKGEAVHSSAEAVGEFSSSVQMLNQIHHLIDAAIENNSVSLFTDCPHREKLGWLEQTHLVAPGLIFNRNLEQLFAATDANIRDAQKSDGMVPTIAPQYTSFGPKYPVFDDSPEWGSATVLAEWAAYTAYGDKVELERAYPSMQHYVSYLESKATNGIVAYGLGDWYDIGPGTPGFSKLTTTGVTGTLMLYQDAVAMEKIAKILGHEDDAHSYHALANHTADTFNTKFFDATTSQYDRGSQTANAMPLDLKLVPGDQRAAVLKHIVEDIEAHSDHVTTGEVGYPYLLRTLMENGQNDLVLVMMLRNDPPSYGSQLAAGATSLTEAWDANPKSSQDHFMLGAAEEWFYRGLGGIDFDLSRENDERITLRPHVVNSIDWVKCSYDSKLGLIRSSWRRDGNIITIEVTVPANAVATVWIPLVNDKTLVSGDDLPEVKMLQKTSDSIAYRIASGNYRFVIQQQ
jgi:alpha-L-rhamnosidase